MAKKVIKDASENGSENPKIGSEQFEIGETVFCIVNSDVTTIVDDLSKDWSAWSKVPVPKN